MKPRTKTALGIDIGSRRVSAALVERTPRGFRVVAVANCDLSTNDSQPPSVRARRISRTLRRLGRRARAHAAGVAVAVSSNSTMMRLLDLPRQMPTNVGEFVATELNQYVALSGRRRRTDFCGIGTGSAAQKRLLAVAADAEEMEEIFRMCSAAGITVDSVEPAVLAYARAFLAGEKDARHNGGALIAMLSDSSLVMCLFCRGILDFVRIRDLPAGMSSPELIRAWLAEELNVVLQYHRSGAPNIGADAQIRLVIHDAAYDGSDVTPSCVPDTKLSAVADSCEGAGFFCEVAEGISSSPSAVAVGAALKLLEVEEDELQIDLTPHEVIRARSSSRRLLIVANAAALMFLAVFLIVQFLARTTEAMNRRVGQARLNEQLYTMPAMAAQDLYFDEEIARIRRQLAGMDAVRAKREADWPMTLDAIAQSAPPGVCLTTLVCDDNRRVSLKGGAVSYDRVRLFVQNLDGRDCFESVRPLRMERRQIDADVIQYVIECMLKTVKEESFRDDRSQP
ncbi:MAG: PilN domain-containing protein [Phycisphaerales bacterium]